MDPADELQIVEAGQIRLECSGEGKWPGNRHAAVDASAIVVASAPLSRRISVDLPAPLRPMIPRFSPLRQIEGDAVQHSSEAGAGSGSALVSSSTSKHQLLHSAAASARTVQERGASSRDRSWHR